MEGHYWQQTLGRRLSRRQTIVASGGTAAAAAFLAACGGSSKSSGKSDTKSSLPKDTSGLIAQPNDTTKQAKRGGTLKRNINAEPPNLDVMQNYTQQVPFTETVVGRLVGFKPGHLTPAQEDQVDGDLCDSWEFSPDRLQITLKMRPGVKWHPVAPVNSREVDVDDVLYTWKRFSTLGNQRAGLANVANPDAPVLSVTAPDSKTIVIKLKDPIIYALSMFGARENVNLMPKEADDPNKLDPRNKLIATGPYYISDYQRSVGFTLKRHPDFYNKDIGFADQIDYPIIPEYTAQAAQMRAGNIYIASGTGVGFTIKQEEIVPLKKDVPDLNMYVDGYLLYGNKTIFGRKTTAFRDERVRQALSMSYDRDLWIEVWNNASKFESAGLPISRRWVSNLPSIVGSYDGWRVEPRDPKEFGPNQKYYVHDIAEAKKLMAAAGFANGLEAPSTFIKGAEYGVDFQKQVEARQGMNAEVGFKFNNRLIDYQTEFIPQIRDANGNFEGLSYRSGPPATSADPVGQYTFFYYSKAGPSYYGFDPNGKGDGSGDPYVDQTIVKAQQEADTEKRRSLIHDLDKYLGSKMYAINGLGGANAFGLAWPTVQNYNVWTGGSANTNRVQNTYWWLDDSKAPTKKS